MKKIIARVVAAALVMSHVPAALAQDYAKYTPEAMDKELSQLAVSRNLSQKLLSSSSFMAPQT